MADKTQDIFAQYEQCRISEKQAECELEYRIRNVTPSKAVSIIESLIKRPNFQPSMEQTISAIQGSKRRIIYFVDGVKTHEIYNEKKQLHKQHTAAYKLVLSTETPVDTFPITRAEIRFRSRLSFANPLYPWRYDITMVESASGAASIASKKAKLFAKTPSIAEYLAIITDASPAVRIELEIEYIGPPVIDREIHPLDLLESNNSNTEDKFAIIGYLKGLQQRLLGAKRINTTSLKRFLPQVKTLTRTLHVELFPYDGWLCKDKADGVSCIIDCHNDQLRIVTSSVRSSSVRSSSVRSFVGTTAVGELLDDNSIHIFDVLILDGKPVHTLPKIQRIELLEEAAKQLMDASTMQIYVAKYYTLNTSSLVETLRDIAAYTKTRPYKTDGWIISNSSDAFFDEVVYKIKLDNPIDFLAVPCPAIAYGHEPYVGRKGYKLYLLFCGINHNLFQSLGMRHISVYREIFPITQPEYYPVHFAPSDSPLAYLWYCPDDVALSEGNVIVELLRTNDGWKLLRERTDRRNETNYYGNDFIVAETNWQNVINPIIKRGIADLAEPPVQYFQRNKDDIYRAQTAFNSFVKTQLISEYCTNATWVLDIASGRGADMRRYMRVGVKKILYTDQDIDALCELMRRRWAVDLKEQLAGTTTYIAQIDMTSLPEEQLARIEAINDRQFNVVVCNFAFHYFTSDATATTNVLNIIDRCTLPGGFFILTTFDGKRIFDLLKGESWTSRQNDNVKYSIQRKYVSNRITNYGQKIGVLHPFSSRGEHYDEYLVNFAMLKQQLQQRSFKLVHHIGFEDYLKEFAQANATVYDELTDDDKQYVSLYCAGIYQKKTAKRVVRKKQK